MSDKKLTLITIATMAGILFLVSGIVYGASIGYQKVFGHHGMVESHHNKNLANSCENGMEYNARFNNQHLTNMEHKYASIGHEIRYEDHTNEPKILKVINVYKKVDKERQVIKKAGRYCVRQNNNFN